jgi:hypothetical protein
MRITERVSEHTRDLAVTRGSSYQYLDASDETLKNLTKQLDSNSDREKLDAMKRLIAASLFLNILSVKRLTMAICSSFPKAVTYLSTSLKLSKT